MKRPIVLVPLDGSVFSQQIFPYLLRLFDLKMHSLILLRVAELPAGVTGVPAWPISSTWPLPTHVSGREIERANYPIYASQEEQSTRAALERELLKAARLLEDAGYRVSVAVRFGDPAEEIVAFAKANKVDLVAMATHGRTGLRQLMLGSVAEQVLRTLDVPVMLMRPSDDTTN